MHGSTRRQVMAAGAAFAGTGLLPAMAQAQDEQAAWRTAAPYPSAVQEIYAALHQGRIWIAGGLVPGSGAADIGITEKVFAFDLASGVWEEGPPLPAPRHHVGLVAHEGRLYAIGGFEAAAGGIWQAVTHVEALEDGAWRRVAPLPYAQAESVSASLATGLHLVTGRRPAATRNAGYADHAETNAHLVYDGREDRWRAAAPAPVARNSAAGALLGGALYLAGGRTMTGGNIAAFERYDPDSDRWTGLPAMPEGRGGLAAAAVEGRVFLFGGEWFEDDGGVYSDVLAFDPEAGAWSRLGAMPQPRHGLAACAEGGRIHLIGGALRAGGNGTTGAHSVFTP